MQALPAAKAIILLRSVREAIEELSTQARHTTPRHATPTRALTHTHTLTLMHTLSHARTRARYAPRSLVPHTQAHLYSSSGHRRPASISRAVQRPAVSAVLGRGGGRGSADRRPPPDAAGSRAGGSLRAPRGRC